MALLSKVPGIGTSRRSRRELLLQTFLPYPDFRESARVLDRQRLGKQRVEAVCILKVRLYKRGGWANHPATLMWAGCELMLCHYAICVIDEWRSRGYVDTMREIVLDELAPNFPLHTAKNPHWLGDPRFHIAHQSNLIRKNPTHYQQFFPDIPPDIPYYWPEP